MPKQTAERAGWSPAEWGDRYGVSRSTVYKLIRAGQLRVAKVGTRTIITREADEEYRKSLNSGAKV